MFYRLLLASIGFYFIILEVDTKKKRFKSINTDFSQNERKRFMREYQQLGDTFANCNVEDDFIFNSAINEPYDTTTYGYNTDQSCPDTAGPSNSFYPNFSSIVAPSNYKNPDYDYSDIAGTSNYKNPCSLNKAGTSYDAGQVSNTNQYYEPVPNFTDNLLQYPYDQGAIVGEVTTNVEQQQNTNVPAAADQILATLPPGPHNFIQVEGKSHDVRRYCEKHSENYHCSTRVRTKCNTCNTMLCAQCYAIEHGSASIPTIKTIPEFLKCVYCGYSMVNTQYDMTRHFYRCGKVPSNTGIYRIYWCCACGKHSNKLYNFELHLRTHSGERPYMCDYCQKEYKDKSHLKKHMRKHVANLTDEEDEE